MISFADVRDEIGRFASNRWAISLGAAACTQRLYPHLEKYFLSNASRENFRRSFICGDVLGKIWACIGARSASDFLQSEELLELENALISEDEAFSAGHPYSVDAMESLAISSRYLVSGNIGEALATFEQSYNVVDNFVVRVLRLSTATLEDEKIVVSQPIVQRELQRQLRDLRQACAAVQRQFPQVCVELKRRAENEGASIFSE